MTQCSPLAYFVCCKTAVEPCGYDINRFQLRFRKARPIMLLNLNHSLARRCTSLALLFVVAVAATFSLPLPRTAAQSANLIEAGQAARSASGDVAADPQTQMPPALREAVERSRYRISEQESAAVPGGYQAMNPAQAFSATFAKAGLRVQPHIASVKAESAAAESAQAASAAGWQWGMSLRGYGYGERMQEATPATLVAADNRIEYRRGELTEWYVNDQRGLEQGFTLAARPAGGEGREPLVVRLSVEGDLRAEGSADHQHIYFVGESGAYVLSYSGLAAFDAHGKRLAARMRIAEGEVRLEVEDEGAEYPLTIDPLIATETKLTASDAAEDDYFGSSVAISGNTAVVGASRDNTAAGVDAGSAYVFVRNSNGIWSQQAKFTANDAAAGDQFGLSVAISGDTIVVGAWRDDTSAGQDKGSAYVYERSNGLWIEQAKLTASDAEIEDSFGEDLFGKSVAISGYTIVVGAVVDTTTAGVDAGSAYVFVRFLGVWIEQAKLTASDADGLDAFGESVAISGDTIVVGAIGEGFQPIGSAYVYVRSNGVWSEQAKLTASDALANDRFGRSVAISGDTIVVGAFGDDLIIPIPPPLYIKLVQDAGSAYVYTRSNGVWSQQAKLTAGDAAANDWFGVSVAISGNTVVVGAWRDDTSAGEDAGSAYVYVRSSGQWSHQLKLTASDAAANDCFGVSVAISGNISGTTIVVGAFGDNIAAGEDAGSAYIKRLTNPVTL